VVLGAPQTTPRNRKQRKLSIYGFGRRPDLYLQSLVYHQAAQALRAPCGKGFRQRCSSQWVPEVRGLTGPPLGRNPKKNKSGEKQTNHKIFIGTPGVNMGYPLLCEECSGNRCRVHSGGGSADGSSCMLTRRLDHEVPVEGENGRFNPPTPRVV